ncbi:A/G-specific adenine glycosylase [Fibrobacter succinogenes]|uniref:Adenine DNA glycosylase n=1 Tax=Fibrobacter succinogenes TaxID=833 RepID=A0A380S7T4_FIBSU|nr:A/G-specific adenine glycosylase [Fibrobacter succinogenes]PWJ33541.1 A/G-specific DNA-adenine glycosylase [Fibrobacter succinogenes subsp. elongatus]SUQ25912.1 A/G-specific DNA-adenine glycosylase [Fibrobacter succinogenes]
MTPDSLKRLREWFRANAAELPWRPADLDAPRDPYAVWISETMLQQTQVSTVRDYFTRWMKRFPDVETLAKADEAEVFKYWQGLGYYSRARNILKTAKIVCENSLDPLRSASRMTGVRKMPETRKELEALPGIGAYTAGAILSLAYHQREAILDGNLVRIFSRLYELEFLPTDKSRNGGSASEIYWEYAREVADSPKAYMHNEALMELGRTVCKTKSPLCETCPLHKECRAFLDGRTAEFPPAKKRTEKSWHGTVLVVESADEKILAVNGGQKFLDKQLALPHFESARHATVALPAKAEDYINADEVESVEHCGTFRHSITVHKIECDVLHVRLSIKAKSAHLPKPTTFEWIEKAKALETFANSFSLKALKKIMDPLPDGRGMTRAN